MGDESTAIDRHRDPYGLDRYLIRRKVFKILGGAFHIYDPLQENVYFYAEKKAFKLKDDFTVFQDTEKAIPLLKIKARNIMDFSGTFDITDVRSGEVVGAVRRKGLKSMLRDEWEILGTGDALLGTAQEDSMLLALIRRFLVKLVPQSYTLTSTEGHELGEFRQRFNPFVFKMELDYSRDSEQVLDRRLGIGLAVCMMAIEGRQNDA